MSNPGQAMSDKITTTEAMKILGISRTGLNRLMENKELDFETNWSGWLVFERADVEKLKETPK